VIARSIGFRRAGRLLQHSFRPTRLDCSLLPFLQGKPFGEAGAELM